MFCGTGSIGNALPANSKPPAPSCANSHQNSNTVQVGATCLCVRKCKAKEHGHCQKKYCQGFWRLFGEGRLFGRPFFKINPQELSTLCIYPKNSWTTQRMCQSKKSVCHNSCPRFYPGTSEEHPMNNHDLNRALFWHCRALERKCINSTGLWEGWYSKASWALSGTYTSYKIIYSFTVACMLTGVLSKLAHPYQSSRRKTRLFKRVGAPQLAFDRTLPPTLKTAWSSRFQQSIYLSISIYLCIRTCLGDSSWYLTISLVLPTNYWKTWPGMQPWIP